MISIRGKKGQELMSGMMTYIILVLIVGGVGFYIVSKIRTAQKGVDDVLGLDKCIKTGKTAEYYQTEINSLLEDGRNDRAAKSYADFVSCFQKKSLEFEEKDLYNLAIAVYEDNNINLAKALFIRYKSEFSKGSDIDDVNKIIEYLQGEGNQNP